MVWAGHAAAAPETHDGFGLRLGLGPAGVAGSAKVEGDDSLELGGSGTVLDIAIGGAVAENLLLHGTLTGFLVSEPEVDRVGGPDGTLEDTDLDLSTVGVGVTYYIMPTNLYLSASLVAVRLTLREKDGDEIAESDTGGGVQLAIGKEWWVSDDWGLGLGAVLLGASISGENSNKQDVEWSLGSFGLYFSATYN